MLGCVSQNSNLDEAKTIKQEDNSLNTNYEKNQLMENQQSSEPNNTSLNTSLSKDKKFFTMEQISKHNNKNDCYLLIEGKVYDVTKFIASGKHPPDIEMGCGKDATILFKQRRTPDGQIIGSGKPHSAKAEELLQNFYIGDLKQD